MSDIKLKLYCWFLFLLSVSLFMWTLYMYGLNSLKFELLRSGHRIGWPKKSTYSSTLEIRGCLTLLLFVVSERHLLWNTLNGNIDDLKSTISLVPYDMEEVPCKNLHGTKRRFWTIFDHFRCWLFSNTERRPLHAYSGSDAFFSREAHKVSQTQFANDFLFIFK